MLLFYSCFEKGEEEETDGDTAIPCAGELPEVLLNTWSTKGLICDDFVECNNGDCFNFTRILRPDSTYSISSIYFVEENDATTTMTYEDEGEFEFHCTTRGRFNRRFTYFYVEGDLVLNSFERAPLSFPLRWDGFMWFQVPPRAIIEDIDCRMYLPGQ